MSDTIRGGTYLDKPAVTYSPKNGGQNPTSRDIIRNLSIHGAFFETFYKRQNNIVEACP